MKISFCGTGLMGYPMAERLIEAGHQLTVYNRTASKAKPLQEKGARLSQNPSAAIAESPCSILMLADARSIEEVLFSPSAQDLNEKTIIQMGTIAPAESIEIQKKIFKQGGEYLECPVLGSRNEAKSGKLILMVGASQERFYKWKELLKVFGPHPRHVGEVGKAAAVKLALNQLIASHAAGFSLSLGLIQKNDVNVGLFMDILRESALYATMFDKKLPKWLNQDYSHPNFPVKHFLKDIDLIIKEGKDKELSTEIPEAFRQFLLEAIDKGLADKDYSAVFNAINKI